MTLDVTAGLLLLTKIILLVLLVFYFVFSYVVLTKVKLLAQVLETEVSPILVALVGLNLVVSLGLFVVGLFIL